MMGLLAWDNYGTMAAIGADRYAAHYTDSQFEKHYGDFLDVQ